MPFDFLLSDRTHVFGYVINTGEQTIILNWLEVGLAHTQNAHMGMLDDGRMVVLMNNFVETHWTTELFVLTKTPRKYLPERVIITLGGMWLSPEIRAAVMEFNRESQTHEIQTYDYSSTTDDWQTGFIRLRTELITGGGPDIIYHADEILIDRGLLLDLYPFIDADNLLNRADFFPNVLAALENTDGTLPTIAMSFSIHTMIGMTQTVGHIESWTFADFLALVEESDHITYLLGSGVRGNRDVFLREALMYAGPELIDWHMGVANFDSEMFIHLLEIAKQLPVVQQAGEYVSGFTQMLEGQQLLTVEFLSSPNSYQHIALALGDITALGMPTTQGGYHVIQLNTRLGINAASHHAEEAWMFLRRFLLPTANTHWGFPLRIDQYDAMISHAMTPIIQLDANGKEMELPHGEIGFADGLSITVFAMTEEIANTTRTIVETARPMGRFDPVLWDMVLEEALPFFAGDRAVEDTARIIQNRAQTYLSELR